MKKTKILKITETAHNSLMKVLNRYERLRYSGVSFRAMGCLSGVDEKNVIQKVILIKRTDGCSMMAGFTKIDMGEAAYKIAKEGFDVKTFIRVGKFVNRDSSIYYYAQQINEYGLHMLSVSKKDIREVTGKNGHNIVKYKIVS